MSKNRVKFGNPRVARTVPYSEFVRLTRAVVLARSEDPERETMRYVVLTHEGDALAMAATDGHRIHVGYPSPALVEALAVPKGATWTFDAEYVARLPLKPPADDALILSAFEMPSGTSFPSYAQVMPRDINVGNGSTSKINLAYVADVANAQKVLQAQDAVVTPCTEADGAGPVSFRIYDGPAPGAPGSKKSNKPTEPGRLIFHAVVMTMRL
jgi:hypothetical protein